MPIFSYFPTLLFTDTRCTWRYLPTRSCRSHRMLILISTYQLPVFSSVPIQLPVVNCYLFPCLLSCIFFLRLLWLWRGELSVALSFE